MWMRHHERLSVDTCWTGSRMNTDTTVHRSHRVEAPSVWGTLQVLPTGTYSWDTTAARSTCSWWVRSMTDAWTYHNLRGSRSWSGPSLARGEVTVDPGCRVAGSWFLPSMVWALNSVVQVDTSWQWWFPRVGYPWYRGAVLTSSYWRTELSEMGSVSPSGNWCRYLTHTQTSTFQVSIGSSGSTWFAEP